jgi:AP-1 complex subunit gamma-1
MSKLLYIHMLGYPTHFGQMECIKLIASKRFTEKRLGYLALMLLLDERQEVLMLVTNSLQMDLNSSSPFNAGLALAAIGNIGSAEISRDLAREVELLLKNGEPYVKKKAALCTIRMLRRCPELIETFLPSIVSILLDKHHNVLLAGVALVTAVVEIQPSYTAKFTKLVPALVKILRKLVTAGYAAEYDVGGVTDPFLQAKILTLLRALGTGDANASESMNNILAQVASTIYTGKNAGNAVLYECVKTIMSVESEAGLRVLAVNTLGKFLAGKDNNIKYVALQSLCKVVHVDAPAVQRHRSIIVECLKDGDVSIRKRALELVYALVNEDNVRLLSKEMLNYLAVAESDTKSDLCVKIAAVAERFAPNKPWHIDTLITMLSVAGDTARREIASALIFHVSHASKEDHAAVTHKLFTMASAAVIGANEAQQLLLQVAVWCIGEFGNYLIEAPPSRAMNAAALLAAHAAATFDGHESTPPPQIDDLSGPFGERRSESEIVRLLERIVLLYYASSELKAMVLTALVKLTSRLRGDVQQTQRVLGILSSYSSSSDVELQSRSVEYTQIANPSKTPTLSQPQRQGLVDPMPLLEESVLQSRTGGATGEVVGAEQQMKIIDEFTSDDTTTSAQVRQRGRGGGGGTTHSGGDNSSGSTFESNRSVQNSSKGPVASLLDSLDDLFSSVSSSADISNAAGSSSNINVSSGVSPDLRSSHAASNTLASSSLSGLDDLFAPTPASTSASISNSVSSFPPKIPSQQRQVQQQLGSISSYPSSLSSTSATAVDIFASNASTLPPSLNQLSLSAPAKQIVAPQSSTMQRPQSSSILDTGLDDLLGTTQSVNAGQSSISQNPPHSLLSSFPSSNSQSSSLSSLPQQSIISSSFSAQTHSSSTINSNSDDPFGSFVSSPAHTFTAYENAEWGLKVVLRCEKPQGASSGVTDITATFSVISNKTLRKFICQAAVPKFMKLSLVPANGDEVSRGKDVIQLIKVENSQQGIKPIALRLKLIWGVDGEFSETTDIRGFPTML